MTADGKPDRARIDALLPKVREQLALLDRTVAPSGYLVGGGFTLADIYVLPMLHYLKLMPESWPNAGRFHAARPLSPDAFGTAELRADDSAPGSARGDTHRLGDIFGDRRKFFPSGLSIRARPVRRSHIARQFRGDGGRGSPQQGVFRCASCISLPRRSPIKTRRRR